MASSRLNDEEVCGEECVERNRGRKSEKIERKKWRVKVAFL
jgi:hypothetical protein